MVQRMRQGKGSMSARLHVSKALKHLEIDRDQSTVQPRGISSGDAFVQVLSTFDLCGNEKSCASDCGLLFAARRTLQLVGRSSNFGRMDRQGRVRYLHERSLQTEKCNGKELYPNRTLPRLASSSSNSVPRGIRKDRQRYSTTLPRVQRSKLDTKST